MGMGHVPQDPIHSPRSGAEFQGRERRGTSKRRDSRLVKSVDNPVSLDARRARGAWAERRVAQWYRQHGYEIVAMNWRFHSPHARGEIDVIALLGNVLVICEVKARANDDFGSPLEAISTRKQFVLQRAAYEFVKQHDLRSMHLRFDVAAVTGVVVEVLFDAF
jgi:putative endonuclease